MTSVSDGVSTATASVGVHPRKSPFTRLGSLFASKTSQLSEFYIELNEPHRHYGPGDTVNGKVVLGATKPIGVTHIVISLHGAVQVFKNHNRPKAVPHNTAPLAADGRGKRWVTEYYGDGYASLFEEEIVLCGEGRLDPNVYHFEFEVQFPKHLELPSAIEFERGNICYMVTAMITRPASLTPTMTFQRRVMYRDRVDVSELPRPKARVVTLEPIDRNSKTKSNLKRLTSYTGDKRRQPTASLTSRDARSTRTLSSVPSTIQYEEANSERPTSPSVASTVSASSAGARGSINQTSEARSSTPSAGPVVLIDAPPLRTITATVQLDRSGCMPGEIVPVRIAIEHVKPIRSVNGIVVTLYRQARVDQHPNLPIGPADDGKGSRFEDYYPRSRTGLGGLSLSAAGSSQVWRKDLSQTFAPLIVDPNTFTAQAKVGVRVPEDAFPTIKNAPGEMISFTYSVEVVIDIHGKLASTGSILPKLSMVEGNQSLGNKSSIGEPSGGETLTAIGVNCIDTTQLRREKNAITCLCDLVVGTLDSGKRNERKSSKTSQTNSQPTQAGSDEQNLDSDRPIPGYDGDAWAYQSTSPTYWEGNGYYEHNGYDGYYYDGYGQENGNGYGYGYGDENYYHHQYPGHDEINGHGTVIPPPVEDEEEVSEKERLRRAEARVLPSVPPESDTGFSSAAGPSHLPSAPHLPNGGYHNVVVADPSSRSADSTVSRSPQTISRVTQATHVDELAAADPCKTPTLADADPQQINTRSIDTTLSNCGGFGGRRSEHEVGSPVMGEAEPGHRRSDASTDAQASAPSMTEEDEIQSFGPPTSFRDIGHVEVKEQLPQYQR